MRSSVRSQVDFKAINKATCNGSPPGSGKEVKAVKVERKLGKKERKIDPEWKGCAKNIRQSKVTAEAWTRTKQVYKNCAGNSNSRNFGWFSCFCPSRVGQVHRACLGGGGVGFEIRRDGSVCPDAELLLGGLQEASVVRHDLVLGQVKVELQRHQHGELESDQLAPVHPKPLLQFL